MATQKSFEEEHGEGLCLLKTTNIASSANCEHQMGRKKSSAEEHVECIVIAPPSFSILDKQLATKHITTCTSAKDNLLRLKEDFQEHVNYFFRVLLSNTTDSPGHEDLKGLKFFFTEEDTVKACSLFLTNRNLKNLLSWTVTAASIKDQAGLMKSFRGFEERSVQSLLSELLSETITSPVHEDITWLNISLKKEQGLMVKACSLFVIDRNLTYLLPGSTAAARSKDQVVLKKSFGECEGGIIKLKQRILPDEVIVFEILTRVPLGALLHQFQWVCREWHNHIHEIKFQRIHSQRTPIVASGFFIVIERSIENISDSIRFFPFNDDPSSLPGNPSPSLDFLPSPVKIVGSSPYGSLLCCVKLQTRKSIPVFYICKPATREWRQIPNPRTRFRDLGMRIVVTQIYPTLQYKIVRISSVRDACEKYHCEIFDSVTWAWKRSVDVRTFCCLADTYGGGVLINGCLHWINYLRQIYAFSIEQEEWSEIIQLPPDIVESKLVHEYLLILIDGKIGVLISNKEWTELWVLENYHSHTSWKRKYRKDLRALNCEVGGVCVPIAMSSTGIIFMICVCPSSRCAVSYNINDDTCTISAPFPLDVGLFLGFPFDSRFCYI